MMAWDVMKSQMSAGYRHHRLLEYQFGARNRCGIGIRLLLAAGLTAAVAGCGTTGASQGTSATASTGPADSGKVIAAMNGGLVSGSIGAGLSAGEKRSALQAEYKALEYTASGQPVDWKGDQASHYGEVVAAQPYRVGSQDCRQYAQTVYAGGSGATARGTACRNADGSWSLLN